MGEKVHKVSATEMPPMTAVSIPDVGLMLAVRDTEREIQRERHRGRDTERERERETQRERQRERERETERESFFSNATAVTTGIGSVSW
jgi:hypothetical protein